MTKKLILMEKFEICDYSKVGHVFVSIATPDKILSKEFYLKGSREEIFEIVVEKSLEFLLENLSR